MCDTFRVMTFGLLTLITSIVIIIILLIMEKLSVIFKRIIVKKFENKLARIKFTVKRLGIKYNKDATARITNVNKDNFTLHISEDEPILTITYDRLISISKPKRIRV